MSKYLKNLHKPCDKIDKYDNEPYMKNPLLKLKLSDIRKYRRQSQLEHFAEKVRNSMVFLDFSSARFVSEQNTIVSKAAR